MTDNIFSILTLNLRFGLANDGPNNWVYREKAFPSLLNQYSSDFMGFQEANDFQTDFLKNILTDYDLIGVRTPASAFWQNNLIFYKKDWKCIYSKHFFLSPTPDIPSRSVKSRWPRQCTIGIFENKNHAVICINTHFDFEESVQAESAEIIMKHLKELPSNIPVILTGDFNALPYSSCYKVFTGKYSDNSPAPFSEENKRIYFKNAFTSPFPATFHGFTGKSGGNHIDWILYHGEITLKNAYVIHEKFNGIYPSDHFPVYAVFQRE